MGNLQNHVKVHLADRIKKWLVVQLRSVLHQRGIVDKDLRALAWRMLSRVEYNEKEAAAIARASGKPIPEIPTWKAPESVQDMLGEDWLGRFTNPPLAEDSLEAIWQVWQ